MFLILVMLLLQLGSQGNVTGNAILSFLFNMNQLYLMWYIKYFQKYAYLYIHLNTNISVISSCC